MYPETPETSEPQPILSARNFLLLQPDLKTVLESASQDNRDPIAASLLRRDGLLWHEGKIFVPETSRPVVLKLLHDHKLAGYFGVHKTLNLVQRTFWWPQMAQQCKDYVLSCTVCQRSKGSNVRSWGLLRPLSIPQCPWREISMDIVVELPPSEGFTAILVVVDRLSKIAHFLPLVGTPTAAETAKIFLKGDRPSARAAQQHHLRQGASVHIKILEEPL